MHPDRWLSIVGIGEDGWESLNAQAKEAVTSARLLYGGRRHLALVPEGSATRLCWPSPMGPAVEHILTEHRGRTRVSVLASGDPMLYGVGVTLTRKLDPGEFRVFPQPSAQSLACARLGWPVADTTLISLVHRPVEQLHRFLFPGERLILYSEDGSSPALIAKTLQQSGFGASQMTVFERLGGPCENRFHRVADSWEGCRCEDLNLVAVLCKAVAGSRSLSSVPGLPDDAFDTDGQLTKREVRAATLALLAPLPGQKLWDVGAGTGSIAIEWMRVHRSCSATAFEAEPRRADRLSGNANKLGVPGLRVVRGEAPATFAGLEPPDAIFIGGGLNAEMFAACWASLPAGGRLVANAVTITSEAMLASLHTTYRGDLVRILVARAAPVGTTEGWRPLMPVTQWSVVKP